MDVDAFWSRVDTSGDCLVWTGAKTPKGYGVLTLNGRRWYAHRLSYTLTNGPIPDGLFVCHRCDHPPCVRPDHLFLGTMQENFADMRRKGRARTKWTGPRPQRWDGRFMFVMPQWKLVEFESALRFLAEERGRSTDECLEDMILRSATARGWRRHQVGARPAAELRGGGGGE